MLSLCVCVSDTDAVSLHIERKMPIALGRHGTDYYKKEFAINASIKVMASFCLPCQGIAATALFQQNLQRVLKRLTIGCFAARMVPSFGTAIPTYPSTFK